MGQKPVRRRGGRSALPSPGIPPPPPLSQEYLATIPERYLRVIALTVQLHDRSSMTKCSNWFGAKARTFLKPPLHILGGYSSWKDVLHGIRRYNEMSAGERQREVVKARGLTRKQKAELKANMDRLMADRPDPTMEGNADDCGAEQLEQLTAAAAARSVAAMKHSSGEAIIRKREAATGRDIEGYAKRRKSACANCGFVRDARVLKAAKCVLPQEPGECVQCIEAAKQWTKKLEKDARLEEIYQHQQKHREACISSSKEVVVEVEAFLEREFGREVAGELAKLPGMRQLSIDVLDLADGHATKQSFASEAGLIAGAEWRLDGEPMHPNILQLPEGRPRALFVKMPRAKDGSPALQNFAFLMNNGFVQSAVDSFVGGEMEAIYACTTGRRPGPASGVFQLGDECHSHTPVTRKDTTFYKASGEKSVHMYAHYRNKRGETKRCNLGYRAMHINRLNTQQKSRRARGLLDYGHILEREALVYIAAIACLDAVGIPPTNSDGHYFSEMRKIFARREEGESVLDCLGKWMCSTGEIRNHEACKCHMDGNSSHPYEILSMFNRSRISRKDGYLYLPLDNACIRVKCDKQSLVSNFTFTPHVADPSRNCSNFSKVHGPCP